MALCADADYVKMRLARLAFGPADPPEDVAVQDTLR